jgi:hypothetical protein
MGSISPAIIDSESIRPFTCRITSAAFMHPKQILLYRKVVKKATVGQPRPVLA